MKNAQTAIDENNQRALDAYAVIRTWALVRFGQDGEDFTHDAYLVLYTAPQRTHTLTLDPVPLQAHWAVMVRKASQAAREQARNMSQYDNTDQISNEAVLTDSQDTQAQAKSLLRYLPQDSRKLLYRIIIDRASVKQTAKDFGLSMSQTQRRYDRGIRQLQEILTAESQVA